MTAQPLFYFEPTTPNPIEFEINTGNTYNSTTFVIRDRTEKGWALDFVFSGYTGTTGNTFFYLGLKDETEPANFIDNNLSFDFTIDDRIRWKKSGYSSSCVDDNTIITISDVTPVICGVSADFNLTIIFERNLAYDDCCEIANEGGKNDLFTGWTITNPESVATGATPIETTEWVLNEKWYKEKHKRLGTLKIYLNGRRIYLKKNWEEVIPTQRQSLNLLEQIWGGGTTGSGGIHEGITPLTILRMAYYESPLSYIDVRDNYLEMKSIYNIVECTSGCDEKPIP